MTAVDHTARLDVAVRPPLLIGLCGFAGAGKTTVGHHLENEYAFTPLAFADPIVNMLGALFADADVPQAFMSERSLKELPTSLGHSYRHLAQTLGTEWGRHVLGADFWLRVAGRKLDQALACGDNVVFTDCRFPNEAEWITSRGGVVVRVVHYEGPTCKWHESEAHADSLPATHELINNGSIGTLHEQIDRLVDTLRGTR